MKISVVIPILYSPSNYLYRKAAKSLIASWEKWKRSTRHSLEIILVFNNFPPEKNFPNLKLRNTKVRILTNALNRGFTGAVNDGVWLAVYQQKADWCLVFNDDALADLGFFKNMIPELKSSRAVVSCGVKNTDGSLQNAGLTYFHSGLTEPLMRFTLTPFFSGTAFFVSAQTIRWSVEQFGWLLIEFFFAYAEDLELSIRLLKENKKTHIHPETLVTHLGSVTAKRGSAFQLYWGYRNLLFVIFIHWSWLRIVWSLPALLLGQLHMVAVLVLKGYWLSYPKILWSVWKNRAILKLYRKVFYEKLTHYYSF